MIGWLEGDGHIDKQSGKAVGTTVSSNLAYQISTMLNSMNINHSLYFEDGELGGIINGRQIIGGIKYRIKIPYNEIKPLIKQSNKLNYSLNVKYKKINAFTDRYCLHNLLDRKSERYFGNVYSLKVGGGNSYVASGICCYG